MKLGYDWKEMIDVYCHFIHLDWNLGSHNLLTILNYIVCPSLTKTDLLHQQWQS